MRATASPSTWQPLGPTAVQTPGFGLVTGRVAALALDPSDATGNRLYLGTTGGGVWVAQNAGTSNPSSIVFTPLTDTLAALGGAADASISIGALTVQPGGTGVILAGTGDPNDVLDSYYGAGILRSTDGGNYMEPDCEDRGCGARAGVRTTALSGEGFAGFAWSTVNPQLVVAAVSQAYEGTLVNAEQPATAMRGCITRRTAAPRGTGHHYGRQRERRAGAAGGVCERPTAMRPRRWCGTRCGSCLWPRCASTAITSRRTASRGRA